MPTLKEMTDRFMAMALMPDAEAKAAIEHLNKWVAQEGIELSPGDVIKPKVVEERCDTCRFWRQYQTNDVFYPSGSCCRHAPGRWWLP